MTQKKEILHDYASDMLGVEKHTLESVERQTRDDKIRTYRDAYELLMQIETVLTGHTLRLEQYLSTVDGSSESMIKRAAAIAMGAISGLYGKYRPEDPVSRSLRDDYTALSLATISYTMLHTTALSLDDSSLAELSLKHLNELTPFVVQLSRIIPYVVARELAEEGKIPFTSAGVQAEANTQRAWNHEAVGK